MVLIENESENGKCMDSMARDMRHPYIPSTTVLGDSVPRPRARVYESLD